MAESILYTLAAELLKSLGSQAVQAVAPAFNFKSDLRSLETTINSIKNVLLDAEERQVEDRTVTDWLRKLRAVLYEVEDLLEDFVASSAAWQGKSFAAKVKLFFSSSNKLYQACRISHQIKEIRKNLDDIDSDRQRYKFSERPIDAPNLRRWRREDTDSFIDEKEVIGRDGDKKIIMDMLFASNVEQQKASVICIVGMGGLGKTALAKLVFNDSAVKEQFDMRLWVCVGEEFGLKTIIQRVLNSAAPDEPCDDMEKLRGKRYLLVLDDVWNVNRAEWLDVRSRLGPCGDRSKILVTTRQERVAKIMVDGSARYKLEGLSAEESWSLFEKLAFERGQERNAHLVELGKDIVKKCGGVPLAIQALASYLYARDKQEWLSVRDKELSQIEGEVADTMEVLKLSYRHLWSPLKQCFAYCSLFPPDTRMKKETLIGLWMAQGFILSSDDQSLEETGEKYFAELVQRCFFQDIERDRLGNIIYCKMHDLMHELAKMVSEGEIMSAIKGRTSLGEGVSHVSFEILVPSEISTTLSSVMSLRTLVLNNCCPLDDLGDVLLSSLRRLRVLQVESASIRTVPRSIGKLIHLRYLCLSDRSIKTLPDSLGNLLNLQTLKLALNSLEVLPSMIERLTSLRHLDLTGCSHLDRMPSGTGKLTKLRTLPWFMVGMRNASSLSPESHCGRFTDLKDLNGLRGELCIRILGRLGAEQRQSNAANLRGKAGLLKLHVILGNCEDDEAIMEGLQPHPDLKELVIENYGGLRLPSSMDQLNSALPNLVNIRLEKFIRCQHLPSFAQLASLRNLSLSNCPGVVYMESSIGYKSAASTSQSSASVMPLFFPSLENLWLRDMPNMKGWWKGSERGEGEGSEIVEQPWQLDASNPRPLLPSFPKLSHLVIHDCPNLTCSPAPLSPYVEELELIGVDEKMWSFPFPKHLKYRSIIRDEKEVIIGRDDDKNIIINMLFAPNVEQQKASVICIVGMGGLGKTALAKLVFNDDAVRKQFDMMLWVCVGQEFGFRTIIQRVVKSAAPDEPCNDLEMNQLCCRLQEKLRGKRYLLVLDDVWNENRAEWLNVRSRLGPCGDGSKILVTTRLQRVADIMVDGFPPHDLGGLSPKESWSLFEKLAFLPRQEQNALLVELGKDIVLKCGGVPLAIRALASYLYARDEGKWLSVRDKELSQIEGEVADTMEVLKLSYRHLWSPLKNCFAYCSLFPRDTRMKKETLIGLWMAQGFILSSDDQSLEETGEKYFTELVQRCFFQDIERDRWGNIIYCKMHHLMHELAKKVSEGEIMSAIKGRTSLAEGVSHVSFDFFFTVPSEIPTSLFLLLMSLRTLIFHASPSDHVFSALLSSLKSLRVLELNEASEIRSMPRSIGKLVNLRYLCLSDCSIETLPDSIGNLLDLQTLKLAWSMLRVLPSVIERLTSLRHLDLSGSHNLIRMAADISKLTNLRHLDLSDCSKLTHVAADISSLTNLELLDLTDCSSLDHMPSGTGKLTKLRTLPWFMVGMRYASLSPESHCGRFTDLKDLYGLRGELCIHILGKLGAEQRHSNAANLRGKAGLLMLSVNFLNCEDDDEAIMEGLQPRPDLKELVIQNYGGLRLPSSMALPNLVDIVLENCSRCQHLPSFAQLASLRKLSLWNCPGVEYMESSIGYKSAASPSQSSASVMPLFFPSLENLSLKNMENMKGWWKGEERGEGEGSEIVEQPWQLDASNPRPLLPSFPKLSHLWIWKCPKLICSPAPLSPYVEELVLWEVHQKMVWMLKGQMATTVDENSSFSSLSPSFSTLPVSNLKTLEIRWLTILESFPRDCFKGLTSLQSLEIIDLRPLRSLSGLEHLTGLRELRIESCYEVDLSDDEMMPWEALKSLRRLVLISIPKMSTVPAGFQHLTALESLEIWKCRKLGALPEWVTSLPSLQRIEMDNG